VFGLAGLVVYELHGEVEQNSQRRSSLRMSRNAFSNRNSLGGLSPPSGKTLLGLNDPASSTAVSGSSCISNSNRSANRSRSIAENLRAYSIDAARAVIRLVIGHAGLQDATPLLFPHKRKFPRFVHIALDSKTLARVSL
jgi:hypothetical protein